MSAVAQLYKANLSLLADLYEFTMGAGYETADLAGCEAVFSLSFRNLPFSGGYAIAAGLDDALEVLERFHFDPEDLGYLASLQVAGGRPMFPREYVEMLRGLHFTCDVDAIPEGTVVFPNEPLIRVRGPLLQAQIVESMLLSIVGFQTLIATKAARVVEAAGDAPVMEFGLRRAQGPTAEFRLRAAPTSAALRPLPTSWPVASTGSPSGARMPIPGSRCSRTSSVPSTSTPMPSRTT